MNLLQPLTIDEAKTGSVELVPTKEFFKPVVVITAPCSRESASVLGCDYLFDHAGNPVPFEGTHKLAGELSGALVTFASSLSGEVELKTEKAAHFGLHREEKKGLRLQFRIHLAEDEGQLFKLLELLRELNKEQFSVTLQSSQRSVFEAAGDGPLSKADARQFPFTIHHGARGSGPARIAIAGAVWVLERDGAFIAGWECKGLGLKTADVGGRALSADNPVHVTEDEAKQWAVEELLFFAKDINADGPKDIKAVAELVDWCLATCPALARQETASAQ